MKIQNPTHRLYGRLLIVVSLALGTAVTARADYQSTVISDNPLAYYPINSSVDPIGTTATDLSGNGNNGTYNGTDPEFNTVPGPSMYLSNALYFDGFTSFVDLSTGTNTGILNFSGPIAMEAWVQSANTTQGPKNIIAKGYESSVNSEITLRANGGNWFGASYNGGTHGASGGQQTTNWTHLVCTYDGTNWGLYVDGSLVQSNPDGTGALNFSFPWRIGTGSGDYGASRYFLGNITQVALYNHGLSAAQVLNHFCMGELGTSSTNSIPIITAQPQPQSAVFGGTATFSVGVVSALPTTNQWFKNNVAMAGKTNATLTLTNVGAGDAVNYRVVVGNSNGTTNSVSVSLTVLAANSLKWNSGGTSGVWDTGITADWLNLSNSTMTVFSNYDQVLFDDTVGVSNNVIINGTVSPSAINVNSSTNNFTFNQGTSPLLSGNGSLVKSGSSLLTIFSPQGFSGAVKISGGTIYAGNNCFNLVSSITITNNSTLDLGGGTFNTSKPITVSGTGANGQGAIYNSYNDTPGEVMNITLAGDTKFGSSARWDLVNGSQISGPHKLTLDWSAGSGYGEWNTVTIGANVTGITLTNGTLGSKNMDSTFQNPGTVFTISPGRQLVFWNGGWNGSIHALNGSQVVHYTAPSGFHGSNITLEDNVDWQSYGNTDQTTPVDSAITLNGVAHFEFGDHNMVFTNVISGSGGFVWDHWNHQMVLSVSNTYTGPSVIGDGPQVALVGNGSISHSSLIFFGGNNSASVHVDASGRPDKTLTLASGQTLGGIGAINGSLVVSAGATVSPAGTNTTIGITTGANATGTIGATNAVTLNGTTTLKLNGSGVNDQVQAGAGITYGGTLNLVNISGAPYAVGNLFQIFSAASYTGSFASITPAAPGTGMAWSLTNGFLSVVSASQPVIGSVVVSGGNLIFSGTNGTAGASYSVLTTTNLATPLTNWTALVTNTFDGTGAFSVTNPISVGTPQQFYNIKLVP